MSLPSFSSKVIVRNKTFQNILLLISQHFRRFEINILSASQWNLSSQSAREINCSNYQIVLSDWWETGNKYFTSNCFIWKYFSYTRGICLQIKQTVDQSRVENFLPVILNLSLLDVINPSVSVQNLFRFIQSLGVDQSVVISLISMTWEKSMN